MLFQCWSSDEDGVPTLKQLWVNAPGLLWCSLDGGHYMITGRHDEIRHSSMSKMRDSQPVYIIHLATETGNCA